MLLAARIVEAAWDATKDVGTDKAYPEAVFDRVTSYVQTTPIGEDANFKVVVCILRQLMVLLLVPNTLWTSNSLRGDRLPFKTSC